MMRSIRNHVLCPQSKNINIKINKIKLKNILEI